MRHKRLLMVADTQNAETLGSCVSRKKRLPLGNYWCPIKIFIITGTYLLIITIKAPQGAFIVIMSEYYFISTRALVVPSALISFTTYAPVSGATLSF